ncbi:Guanine nucleotide exchange factor [Entamoeba marina]
MSRSTHLILRTKCRLLETKTVGKDEIPTFQFPSSLKEVTASTTNIGYVTEANELFVSGYILDPTSKTRASLFPPDQPTPSNNVIPQPIKIDGLPSPIDKTALGFYFCTILSKGRLYSWGTSQWGQLGRPEVYDASVPELIPQISDIVDVVSGEFHTIALNIWGEVFSWGKNEFGQLGGSLAPFEEVPYQIPSLKTMVVTRIFCGRMCSACVTQDGKGFLWGKHIKIQKLRRVPTMLSLRSLPSAFTSIISVELSDNDIFIVLHDGRMYRFIDYDKFEEVPIVSPIGVTRAAVGPHFTLVETDNSDVYTVHPTSSPTVLLKHDALINNTHIASMCVNGASSILLVAQSAQYSALKSIILSLRKFLRQLEGIVAHYSDPLSSYVLSLEKSDQKILRNSNTRKPRFSVGHRDDKIQRSSSEKSPRLITAQKDDKKSPRTSEKLKMDPDAPYVASTDDVQKIFYGIKPLAYVLPGLLHAFVNVLDTWHPTATLHHQLQSFLELSISRAFVDVATNSGEAFAQLQFVKKNSPQVVHFLQKQENTFDQFDFDVVFDKRSDLPSLLLLPIKFVPEFYMKIKSYHKTLPEEHSDYIEIQKLLPQFDKLLTRINDSFHLDDIFDIIKCFPDENGCVSITSGTVTDLIDRLYNLNLNDPSYVDMFIMTHRKFTNSETVINRLVNIYNTTASDDARVGIISVFCQWLRKFVIDFEKNTPLLTKIKDISTIQKSDSPKIERGKTALLSLMNGVSVALQLRTKTRLHLPLRPQTSLTYKLFFPTQAQGFAQTLVYFNTIIFSRVSYEELIVMNWSNPKNREKTPNLQNMTDRFNWIGDFIVSSFEQCPKGERAKFIEGLLKFMKTLRDLRDIHFLVASMYSLPRLDIEKIKTKKISCDDNAFINEYEQICSFQHNYKRLRTYISQLETPYIPFIGVLSKDLMLVDEGNSDKLSDGTINLFKWRKVYELIQTVLSAQDPNPTLSYSNEELQILVQQVYGFK